MFLFFKQLWLCAMHFQLSDLHSVPAEVYKMRDIVALRCWLQNSHCKRCSVRSLTSQLMCGVWLSFIGISALVPFDTVGWASDV